MEMLSRHVDHGFDHGGVAGYFRETLRGVGEGEAMGDPRGGIDAAGLNERDDIAECAGRGIAAGQESEFAPVEIGIVERDVALKQADEDDATAGSRQIERASHRFGISSRIDDNGGQIAVE